MFKKLLPHDQTAQIRFQQLIKKRSAIHEEQNKIYKEIIDDDFDTGDGFALAGEIDEKKYAPQLKRYAFLAQEMRRYDVEIQELRKIISSSSNSVQKKTTAPTNQPIASSSAKPIHRPETTRVNREKDEPPTQQNQFIRRLTTIQSSFYRASPLKEHALAALEGNVESISYLADYYQAKKEYGRAMLFSALAVTYHTLPMNKMKYKNYLEYVTPTKFWDPQLEELKSFYRTSVTQTLAEPFLLSGLKTENNITDPIILILLSLNQLDGTMYYNSTIPQRIIKSIKSFFRDALNLSSDGAEKQYNEKMKHVEKIYTNRTSKCEKSF